jgi:TonB-linked SusC/RagA family outer membrane protein
MNVGMRQWRLGAGLLFGTFALAAAPRLLAQQGEIVGQVTDRATSGPLEAARVVLTGANRIETTNREGRYRFRGVEAGNYQVRVLRLGYKPDTATAAVTPGGSATVDFAMTPQPVQLDEIVTTATGEQRKLEVANAVSTIDAARIAEEAPIAEFGNLISGRAAGVQVLKSGGTTGTGTRIRIRGSNSISLSNEPLYYIDGVRMESNSASLSIDISGAINGGTTSRINDLNPDDIESIEIVKGPAAATLYGIQASNGVVKITTKRGTAGRPRWNLFTEAGAVHDYNTYPLNFFGRDTTAATGADFDYYCYLENEVNGDCTQTSITQYSPLQNPATRPLKTGFRQQYGANVSGGSEQVTYYVAAEYEAEDGVFRLPGIEEDSIRNLFGNAPENQVRPNALERVSLRANVGANLNQSSDLSASVGYTSSDTRLVENDNSVLTITGSGETSTNPPTTMEGWYFTPAQLFAELANQGIERFTGGLTYNLRPTSWLSTRATAGYDVVNRDDVQFFPTGRVAPYNQNNDGVRTDNRFQISQTSVDLAATGRFKLNAALGSKTTVGAQFFRDFTSGTLLTGRGLVPGAQSISGAAVIEGKDTTVESRSIGSFIEEEIAVKERLFLTGALRFDDNSAFGENFDLTTYPKASASWLLSEEPFFHSGFMNTLRLRGALGFSGQQPGTIDALRYFTAVAGKREATKSFGVTFGSLGNPDLKPERSREVELGFDAGLFDNKLSVEFTFYHKLTKDALVRRNIAPSLGASEDQFFNLGRIRNRGAELSLDTRLVDRPGFAWDVTLSGSLNSNKILDLGAGIEPIDLGFYQRHVAGYPAGGFWGKTVTFEDADANGIITSNEITVGDTLEFLGNALPTREASLNTAFTLFNNRIRLGGQFDYRGGHVVDNSIENYRCYVGNCRGLTDRTAPLREQALAQAAFSGFSDVVVFAEPGWFIKLRELSLTFNAPDAWARRFRASRMSLTLAGRNLWTITDYSGVDPEVNAFGQENFSSSDFESQPQVRYWTARLNLSF